MQTYPQFQTTKYRPEGGYTAGGAVLLIASSLVAGLLLGGLAGFIGHWLYLVILFPIGIGAGVATVGYWAIRLGKTRNEVLGAISGMLAGFLAMLTVHYTRYVMFEWDASKHVRADERESQRELARMTPNEIKAAKLPKWKKEEALTALADPVVRAAWKVSDFSSYMDFAATAGVTLKDTRNSDDKGFNLGFVGSWIYWIVEIFIVATIARAGQEMAAQDPFCTSCSRWKTTRDLGQVSDADVPALRDGNLPQFSLPADSSPKSLAGVTASVCPQCGMKAPIDVKISWNIQKKDGSTQEKSCHVTYPGSALPYLENILLGASLPTSLVPAPRNVGSKDIQG